MSEQKTIKELAIKQDELALEHAKFTWQQEFQIRELETNAELKRLAINAQFQSSTTSDQLRAEVDRDVAEDNFMLKAHQQLSASTDQGSPDGGDMTGGMGDPMSGQPSEPTPQMPPMGPANLPPQFGGPRMRGGMA